VPECGLAWTSSTTERDRLLRECDVAVVSAPLNEHTEGMIGAEQLRSLDRTWSNLLMTPHSSGSGGSRCHFVTTCQPTTKRSVDGFHAPHRKAATAETPDQASSSFV
jgi:hypothetical protein